MNCVNNVPWPKINDFLLEIEKASADKDFFVQVLKKLFLLIPYDQARIFFANDNGKVNDAILLGVDKWWNDLYLEYYSKIENERYSILRQIDESRQAKVNFRADMLDWTSLNDCEFLNGYIKPQGLKYSLGFGLRDNMGSTYIIYTLDRTKKDGFTQEEINILSTLQPHINNLYNSLAVLMPVRSLPACADKQSLLTKRETEIAKYLYQGITPANISKKLYLSLPTTYKHISNIHSKLNVSNRQELLIKLKDYFL